MYNYRQISNLPLSYIENNYWTRRQISSFWASYIKQSP